MYIYTQYEQNFRLLSPEHLHIFESAARQQLGSNFTGVSAQL